MINADLAEGFQSVLIVAVIVPLTAALMESQINRERTTIERNGGRVTVVTPDKASIETIGPT